MGGRERSRSYTVPGGTAIWHGSGWLGDFPSYMTVNETVADVVGNRDGVNPFYHKRIQSSGWVAEGYTKDPIYDHYAYNGMFSGYPPYPVGWYGESSPPSDSVSIEMAKSRTNPNRPITDLPVFIFEIKDIPRLIKQAGDLILHGRRLLRKEKEALYELPFKAADSYLGYQFGLRPLIRDVSNMMNFVGSVDKKIATLEKLYSNGGRGRSFHSTVYEDTARENPGWVVYVTGLYGDSNLFRISAITERKKWVSIKWKPLEPPPRTVDDKRWLATRLAYGLDISFATLWEAMPWSWLVDWFTNVGDVLQNTRNTVPVSADNSCVMFQTKCRWQFDGRYGDGYAAGGSPKALPAPWLEQTRTPGGSFGGVGLNHELPFLNGNQLSILGALAVSRLGHR